MEKESDDNGCFTLCAVAAPCQDDPNANCGQAPCGTTDPATLEILKEKCPKTCRFCEGNLC